MVPAPPPAVPSAPPGAPPPARPGSTPAAAPAGSSDGARRLPALVVTLTAPQALTPELERAAREGRVALEVRIDRMVPAEAMTLVGRLAQRCPVIATCRRREEGGGWTGAEIGRRSLLEEAAQRGAIVDWEAEAPGDPPAGRLLLSRHFQDPVSAERMLAAADLLEERAWGRKVAAIKVAARVSTFRDELRLLASIRATEARLPPRILIAMGGPATRLLGVPLGAAAGYASPGAEPQAPGQIPWMDVAAMWAEWDPPRPPHEALYLVIGNPVAGSLSPTMHNAAFRHDGRRACYLPLEVPLGHPFPDLLDGLAELDVAGANVTMPFKEAALAAASSAGRDAVEVGAANTLVATEAGWQADNTDVAGIEKALFNADATGGRALVLGSGGAARAALSALARLNYETVLCARNEEARGAIGAAAGLTAGWDRRRVEAADVHVVVQCTPLGMKGTPEASVDPLADADLAGKTVLEMVTSPRRTPLLLHAERDGARVVEGWRPLLWQGLYAHELLTGRQAPREVMEQALRSAIGRREEGPVEVAGE